MDSSPLAGKTVEVISGRFNGELFRVEDFACNVFGTIEWELLFGNPTVLEFLATHKYYPGIEKSALYGKVGMFAHVFCPEELRMLSGEGE